MKVFVYSNWESKLDKILFLYPYAQQITNGLLLLLTPEELEQNLKHPSFAGRLTEKPNCFWLYLDDDTAEPTQE